MYASYSKIDRLLKLFPTISIQSSFSPALYCKILYSIAVEVFYARFEDLWQIDQSSTLTSQYSLQYSIVLAHKLLNVIVSKKFLKIQIRKNSVVYSSGI